MDATSQSSTLPRIVVLGLTGGWADLKAAEIVATTDLLVGGNRQLDTFPHFDGEKLAITRNIAEVVAVIKEARSAGRRVTVLASGDPLCYGIGATLRRSFSAESLHIIPALSSIQLAFSRLAEPWHDAHIISAHGRDNRLALLAIMTHPKTAVLTDRHNSPDALASRLSEMGLPESTSCSRLRATWLS